MSYETKKTKLFYVVNGRMPTEKAYGHQIMHMCGAFSQQDVEVTLMFPKRHNSISQSIFSYYNTSNSFHTQTIQDIDFIRFTSFFGKGAFYLQQIVFGLSFLFTPLPKKSIVYTRSPEIAWIARMRGYMSCYECHDWFGKSVSINTWLLRNVPKLIATNPFIKDKFIEAGFSEERVFVAPHGVDLRTFGTSLEKKEAVRKLSLSEDISSTLLQNKVLLYTGSLMPMGEKKGIDMVIDALPRLEKKNIVLVCVGGSDDENKHYRTVAEKKGIDQRILFFPSVKKEHLTLFQQTAEALLVPFPRAGRYIHFITPLKVFEYMASRKPIVASRLPSLESLLAPDKAYFFEPDNVESFIQVVEKTLSDPQKENIIMNAYDDVKGRTWEGRARDILLFVKT